MKKNYTKVFTQAKKHPKSEQFYQESLARIRLAEALYKARKDKGFSMARLAKKAKTTPAVVSRIENGQVSAGIDIIFRLFKALGKHKVSLNCS